MTTGPAARRRPVVLLTLAIGCTLLGLSLATTPGDNTFYPLLLAVAAVWTVGGLASGPVPWRPRYAITVALRRGVAVGLAAGAVFVLGALVIREIGPLRDYASDVLEHARRGNGALVGVLALLNAVAEEIFFRGALYAAVGPRRTVLLTTVSYVAATAVTGNPLLVAAAVVMGTLFALARRWSGAILEPVVIHLIWSVAMLAALPAIID